MNNFEKDFELRRVIFGLISIIKEANNDIPKIIHERLPEIIK